MIWIEIVCVCALLYGLVSGWINGLFEELVSAGGFLIGLGIAYLYFKTVGCNMWEFIFITILTPAVLGLLATFLTKILDHIYFAGFLNRLLGAVVGCVKWAVIVGIALLIMEKMDTLQQYIPDFLTTFPFHSARP